MTALNTGHREDFATIHANTPASSRPTCGAWSARGNGCSGDGSAGRGGVSDSCPWNVSYWSKRGDSGTDRDFGMEDGVLACTVPIDVVARPQHPGPAWKDCAHCLGLMHGRTFSACSDVGSASIDAWAAAILVKSATRAPAWQYLHSSLTEAAQSLRKVQCFFGSCWVVCA